MKERLEKIIDPSLIKPISIKEGYKEEEIWEIFQTIFDTFREEEEVIVDITHSFRSLPMLMITLLNFAKHVKKIKIRGIYYAAFESLGPINEVSKWSPDKRITPILDLTSFSLLQDWTNATYDFINYGNVRRFSSLLTPEKKYNDENERIDAFFPRKVVDNLNDLVKNIALCRGKALLEFDYKTLKTDIEKLKERELPKPFYYLIDKISEKINPFDNDPVELIKAISDWCIQHNLIQQLITLIQEFTITIILKNINEDYSNTELREVVSQSFRIYSQKIKEKDWLEPASSHKELVNRCIENDLFKKLASDFNSLTSLRNDVNHAGFIEARSVEKIKGKINEIIKSFNSNLQLTNAH